MSRAADKAYIRIRDEIISGVHGPGTHLKEEELSERAGVSRTSVRDALRRLGAEGLVVAEPNRGTFVATFSDGEVDEIFRLRSSMEGYSAAHAARRVTSEQLAALESLIADMDKVAARRAPDLERFARLNNEFHRIIVGAAGMRRLAAMLLPLIDVPLVLLKHHNWHGRVDVARSNEQHREIVQALRAGDPIWARTRMQAHIISTRPRVAAGGIDDEPPLDVL